MSSLIINGSNTLWKNKQWNVVYEQENAPKYLQLTSTLVASTDSTAPLYYSGRILSIITATNATNPQLIGKFLNYQPGSANPDQLIPTHIIAEQFINGMIGLDITTQTSATQTFNLVSATPLIPIGTTLYYNTLVANNTSAVMVGFNAYFNIVTLENIQVNQTSCPLITLQGVS